VRGQRLIEEVAERIAESVRPLFFKTKSAPGESEIYESKLRLADDAIWRATLMQFKEPLHLNVTVFPNSTPLIVFLLCLFCVK